MKNIFSLFIPFALLICGCSLEELQNDQLESQDSRVFTASFEQNETRTYIENGNLLRWNAGDQISLFDANTLNRQYKFDGQTGDNAGTFSLVNAPYGSGNDLTANYAVYPYSANVKITEGGELTVTMPAVQEYAENSFGLASNTMVAVTRDTDDTFLSFRNAAGYFKLQIYGDNVTVKSISLTGNNNEKLAGKASITPLYGDEPTIIMSDEATQIITLNCGDGVKIGTTKETATVFWLVAPPTKFEKGFTITITDTDGGKMTKSTSNVVSIARNIIKPMAVFEVKTIETISNNQIWYTSSDGNVVTPYLNNAFGANIESNIYKNGKGIITFDNDITAIGRNAFQDCTKLTSITFPNSVTSIGKGAFHSCSGLTKVTLADNVTTIGDYAFYGCKSLKNITGLSKIKDIGNFAFYSCSSLIRIDLPSIVNIGSQAFVHCKSLTKVTLSSNMTSIGKGTFGYCSSLKSIAIPQGVTNIENDTFVNCSLLANIVLPNSVTSIGDYAFQSCSIAEIAIPNITAIGKHAFSGCRKLRTLTIPDGVTEIGENAFNSCVSLTNINIPKSVTRIENGTFTGCGIGSIDIHCGVTYIGEGAFKSCSELQNVLIPSSVKTIENEAFCNCTSLREITIQTGVTSIGDRAFFGVGIETITIPDSVIKIGSGLFLYCTSLSSIFVESENPIYDSRNNCNAIIETASNSLIVGCEGTIIPNSVTSILDSAFAGSGLTSITIPGNVAYIGDLAFAICRSLTKVNIEAKTPPMICSTTFLDCNPYIKFYVPAGYLEDYLATEYWKDLNLLSE